MRWYVFDEDSEEAIAGPFDDADAARDWKDKLLQPPDSDPAVGWVYVGEEQPEGRTA